MAAAREPLPDLLDRMRGVGDPVADRVADAVHDTAPDGVRTLADYLSALPRFGEADWEKLAALGGDVPAAMAGFVEATQALPPWHRDLAIRLGNDPFQESTVFGFMVLGCASLLECYSWKVEARLLGMTQQLEKNTGRRIPETAQFVLDVLSDQGIIAADHSDARPGGTRSAGPVPRGIRSIQKVRLMHAFMRHLVLCHPNRLSETVAPPWCHMVERSWSIAEEGVPISQSYLAATLLTFSYIVLRGMRRLGVRVSDEDARDYLHLWKVVGYKLGVDEAFLGWFDDEASARELYRAVAARYRNPTDDGRKLAAALEAYMQDNIVARFPFHRLLGLQRLPRIAMWHLAGRDTCRTVGMVPGVLGRTLGWLPWLVLQAVGAMSRVGPLRQWSLATFAWLGRVVWGWRYEGQEGDARSGRAPVVPGDIAECWRRRSA